MADADLLGPFFGQGVQRAVQDEPQQGPDRTVGGLRPAHPDRLRLGPPPGPRRGGQGGSAHRPHRRHGGPVRADPPGPDEYLHDHQCHRPLAAGAVRGGGGAPGRGPRRAAGHHPERRAQGVPVPRHLHLSARPLRAPHHGPDHLHRGKHPQVEPHQRVQLPPAGSRRHPHPGAGLCPVDGHRHPGRGARLRAGAGRAFCRGSGTDFLLRKRRHPLRGGNLQDARLRHHVEQARRGALRGER